MTIQIQGKKEDIEELPRDIFSAIGMNQIAYIKTIKDDDERELYSVHAADGSQISVSDDWDSAEEIIRFNNLHRVTVH